MAQLINYGVQDWSHGWRLSLGLAAVPAFVLLLGGILLPESPNSLIERWVGGLRGCPGPGGLPLRDTAACGATRQKSALLTATACAPIPGPLPAEATWTAVATCWSGCAAPPTCTQVGWEGGTAGSRAGTTRQRLELQHEHMLSPPG